MKVHRACVNFLVERMFDSIQEVGENATPNVYQYEQNSDLDRYLIDNDIVKYNVQHNGLPNYYDPERVTYFALVRVLHQHPVNHSQIIAWSAKERGEQETWRIV